MKRKLTKILAGVAATALVATASAFYYRDRSPPLNPDIPTFSQVLNCTQICFRDISAQGLESEAIINGGKLVQLDRVGGEIDHSFFEIPSKYRSYNGRLLVWARDEKGQKSSIKELYLKDGCLYTEDPFPKKIKTLKNHHF